MAGVTQRSQSGERQKRMLRACDACSKRKVPMKAISVLGGFSSQQILTYSNID